MEFFKYGPIKAVFALLSIIVLLPMSLAAAPVQAEKNIAYQKTHMEYLENEFYADYTPVDESKIAAFDIDKAVSDGVKLNEIAVIGTHNSYQMKSSEEYDKLYNALDVLTFSIVKGEKTSFNMEPLTQQLEVGIRSLEIDIESVRNGSDTSFIVCHDPLLDNASSCYDFAEAMREIKLWSDNNPGHLPVSVIIEPKGNIVPVDGMVNFDVECARALDSVLRDIFGDTLMTPADVMGDYSSLKEMRENDGWPLLGDSLGKVMVILHPNDVSDKYVAINESMKTQAMFPMVRYADRDESYAAFLLDNKTDEAISHEAETVGKKLIVRTRADKFPDYSEERYEKTKQCASQIISTDYPVRYGESAGHEFTFDGYTVKIVK